tara:strand:+ start:462 stop:776 length:315 start_codon:yes stop_codon:yes gene_type:complete
MEAKVKVTQRMLNKSIMDANKSVVAFAKKYLPYNYDDLQYGEKRTFLFRYDDGMEADLRLYRRPRGDKLMSIQGITKRATAGDVVTISWRGTGIVISVAAHEQT